MTNKKVYILGGYQTDFQVNWTREGKGIFDILKASVEGAFATIHTSGEIKSIEI